MPEKEQNLGWQGILSGAKPLGRLAEKRERIARDLTDRIRRGELKGRLPGVRQLAGAYGVDFRTVDSAMTILAERKIVVRKERSGTFVSSEMDQPQHILGMVLGGSHGPLHTRLLNGIRRQAALRGKRLVFETNLEYTSDPMSSARAANLVLSLGNVDGVLLWPHLPNTDDPAACLLAERNIPFVSVLQVDIARPYPHDYVVSDDRAGVRQAVEHLVKLGHRKIGALGWPHSSPASLAYIHERTAGYNEGMQLAGLDQQTFTPAKLGAQGNLRAFLRKMTAVVFLDSDMAVELWSPLLKAETSRRDPLSLIAYNDTEATQALGISSVRMPMEEIGALSVEVLLDQIENQSRPVVHRMLRPELVLRSTTASPRKGSG
jgi:LacI family transcriptional regulator